MLKSATNLDSQVKKFLQIEIFRWKGHLPSSCFISSSLLSLLSFPSFSPPPSPLSSPSPSPSSPPFHRSLYEPHAFLLDQERSSMLPVMARGLDSILFSIPVDASYLNSLQRGMEVPVVAPQTTPTQTTILDRLLPVAEEGRCGLCACPIGPPTYTFTCTHTHTHTHTHTSPLL